jgi:serine/threonine protein phosphatase PrpC
MPPGGSAGGGKGGAHAGKGAAAGGAASAGGGGAGEGGAAAADADLLPLEAAAAASWAAARASRDFVSFSFGSTPGAPAPTPQSIAEAAEAAIAAAAAAVRDRPFGLGGARTKRRFGLGSGESDGESGSGSDSDGESDASSSSSGGDVDGSDDGSDVSEVVNDEDDDAIWGTGGGGGGGKGAKGSGKGSKAGSSKGKGGSARRKGSGKRPKDEAGAAPADLSAEAIARVRASAWNAAMVGARFVSCPAGANARLGLTFGAADAQGPRSTMEDRIVAIADFNRAIVASAPAIGAVTAPGALPEAAAAGEAGAEAAVAPSHAFPPLAFFAVFDGHNGAETSESLAQALHFRIATHLQLLHHLPGEETPRGPPADAPTPEAPHPAALLAAVVPPRLESLPALLREACLEFDLELQQDIAPGKPISGSTAILCLVVGAGAGASGAAGGGGGGGASGGRTLVIGNVGDSRAVLCRGGRKVELSSDHRCTRPDERARVLAAGGTVVKDRLHGVLAVSRAFGDAEHKRLRGAEMWGRNFSADPLTAEPEVVVEAVRAEDEFVVLACDGVWDVLPSQSVINFVRRRLAAHGDAARAARELVAKAIELATIDNVSAVVVVLTPPAA